MIFVHQRQKGRRSVGLHQGGKLTGAVDHDGVLFADANGQAFGVDGEAGYQGIYSGVQPFEIRPKGGANDDVIVEVAGVLKQYFSGKRTAQGLPYEGIMIRRPEGAIDLSGEFVLKKNR